MRGILTVTPRKEETFISKDTHENIQGKFCVVLEADVGKPAWLAIKMPEDELVPWHRIQTSLVEQTMKDKNKLYIFTEMSTYVITNEKAPVDEVMFLNMNQNVPECWRRH